VRGYHVWTRSATGQAWCWGYGPYGELGDDGGVSSPRPVVVLKPDGSGPQTGIRRVSASYYHSCAVLANGTSVELRARINKRLVAGAARVAEEHVRDLPDLVEVRP